MTKVLPTKQDVLDVMQLYWDEFPTETKIQEHMRTKAVLARLARIRSQLATDAFSKQNSTTLAPTPE